MCPLGPADSVRRSQIGKRKALFCLPSWEERTDRTRAVHRPFLYQQTKLNNFNPTNDGDEPMTLKDDNEPLEEKIDAVIAWLTEGEHDEERKLRVERLREQWRKARELIVDHEFRL